MRLDKSLFCLSVLLFLSLSDLHSQITNQTSATGHIVAEVIPIFTARETAQLNFGRFSPGPQGGEIILSPESTISVLGSVFKGNGMHSAAIFYISGDDNASFTISLPQNPVFLKHVSSSKTLTVKDWISYPGQGPNAGILQNGSLNVFVGATIKVGTLQDNPVGVYAGTYTITFDFN